MQRHGRGSWSVADCSLQHWLFETTEYVDEREPASCVLFAPAKNHWRIALCWPQKNKCDQIMNTLAQMCAWPAGIWTYGGCSMLSPIGSFRTRAAA